MAGVLFQAGKEHNLAKFVPLSRQQHGGMKWSRPKTFGFAVREAYTHVAGLELAAVATSMPMGFVKNDEGFVLVAILSAEPGRNLFIRPDGAWISDSYIPAMFRAHPFKMLRHPDGTKMVLCIDEEAGLVTSAGGEEQFFEEDGKPSKAVSEIMGFLEVLEKSRQVTVLGVKALTEASVIIPWEMNGYQEKGKVLVRGIFRIDEQRLQSLNDETFLKLRLSGALPIAYAQLISMSCLEILARLANHHRAYAEGADKRVELSNLLSGDGNELLRF